MNLELIVLKNNIYYMYIYDWESFNEARIKDGRTPFNIKGGYKKVYKSNTNPNIIIKTFDKKLIYYIKGEENFSIDYPDLFAKIYKIDYNKCIMIQEKLDTSKISNEVSILCKYFTPDVDFKSYVLIHLENLLISKEYSIIESIQKNMTENDLKISNIWINFLKKIVDIDHKKYNTVEGCFDCHEYNFGYDQEGNLKLLDI